MTTRLSQLAASATLTGTELVEVSQLSSSVTKTATTISADSTDNSYNDSGNGFITAGFTTGKAIKVSGFTGNTANNITSGVVTSVAAGKIIIGGTDGDVIVTDAAGESVTITQWDSKRSTAQDVADLAAAATGREVLTGARTYYVRTDGSDSNTGLANTSGAAFLTIQKAIDVVTGTLDISIYDVTISIGSGTFTAANTLKTITGSGYVLIRGGTADLTSTVISTTSASCFSGTFYGVYKFEYMKLQTTTSGDCLSAVAQGTINFQNIAFGACASNHAVANGGGTRVSATGNYTINGSCSGGHLVSYVSSICVYTTALTVTISGTPSLGTFAIASGMGYLYLAGATFSGSATGKRYDATLNGVINTGGQATTWLPGGTAGSTATGGQYA